MNFNGVLEQFVFVYLAMRFIMVSKKDDIVTTESNSNKGEIKELLQIKRMRNPGLSHPFQKTVPISDAFHNIIPIFIKRL